MGLRRFCCGKLHDAEVSAGYRKGQSPRETLLLELCTKLGYCLKPADHERLLQMATNDVDAFTRAVLNAEGLEEPYDKDQLRNVRWLVASHFDRIR